MNIVPVLKSLRSEQVILVLSAHCDDAAIGCGGFLRRIKLENPQCKIRQIVFSGGDDPTRNEEEKAASVAFGIHDTTIHSYPDSLFPNHWHEIKKDLLETRDEIGKEQIGIVLCPRLDDRHQDHKIVAENVWRVFRDHLILEFEIHKYEGDLGQPNLYIGLTDVQASEKADLLLKCYPSRSIHYWWSRENFLGLMRIRGSEVNQPYAEGFIVRKILV